MSDTVILAFARAYGVSVEEARAALDEGYRLRRDAERRRERERAAATRLRRRGLPER